MLFQYVIVDLCDYYRISRIASRGVDIKGPTKMIEGGIDGDSRAHEENR